MTTKKRPEGEGEIEKAKTKRAVKPAAKAPAKPRIHASHAEAKPAARPRTRPAAEGAAPRRAAVPGLKPARAPASRKTPLAGPKRTGAKPRPAVPVPPEASSAAREVALALAAAAIDKKAVGIEILDVTGKVDYADFLVVMTGRSDRHVSAIATGIEEAMRKRKAAPLSIEGLEGATWVLIDFGDVVAHVFQEEARAIYDIEGLWIDAGRVPVPDAEKAEATP